MQPSAHQFPKRRLSSRQSVFGGLILALSLAALFAGDPSVAAGIQPHILDSSNRQQSEVAQYRRTFNASVADAEANLRVQGLAAGVVPVLTILLDDAYAGVWFDNKSGEFVVPLTPSAERGAVVNAFNSMGIGRDGFRIQPANHSWTDLERKQDLVNRDLRNGLLAGELQTAIDPRINEVTVLVANDATPKTQENVADVERAAPEVESYRALHGFHPRNTQCAFGGCSRPGRGGVNIGSKSGGDSCSAGFKAVGDIYANRFILTAGHCTKNRLNMVTDDPDFAGQKDIGVVEETYTDATGFDVGKINANGMWWDTDPWPTEVVYWTHGSAYEAIDPHVPITAEAPSYIGEWACHSGISSGTSCGYVTKVDLALDWDEGAVHQVRTDTSFLTGPDLCIEGGDSGGPVFSGNTALGITGAEESELPRPCGNGDYYSEITTDTDLVGAHVASRAGSRPVVWTEDGTVDAAHKAQVFGGVDPNGLQSTYSFQYGASTSYGLGTGVQNVAAGYQKVGATGSMSNLKGSTVYHYRLVANNLSGTSYGDDRTFTTPDWRPIVSPQAASARTTTTATLNGTVNPQGEAATYHFEWGLTKSYGKSVPVPDGSVGSGTAPVAVSQAISGLKPETTYHFRVVASNGEGTSYSEDRAFTTRAVAPTYNLAFGTLGSGAGQLSAPSGSAIDSSGNLWVADTGNNRIQKFGPKGEFLTQFGSKGSGNGQLSEPTAVALTAAGNLWVADSGNGRIEEFSPAGAYMQQFGGKEGVLEQDYLAKAAGIAVDGEGSIWVTDPGRQSVEKFSENSGVYGHHLASFGGAGLPFVENQEFKAPAGIAADAEGNIWVTDSTRNWLVELQRTVILGVPQYGTYLRVQGTGSGEGQLLEPSAVAVKRSGNLLVAEKGNNRVQQFSPAGEVLALFGAAGSGPGLLSGPRGIAAGPGGTIYVTDTANNRIERWNQPTAPEASTQAASAVKATEATLNATVNPGGRSTTYQFEYGTTASYGSKAPATPGSAGSGADPVTKSQLLTGLKAETTYHFRVLATNSEGTVYGQDATFTTIGPPYDFAFGSAGTGNGQFNGPGGAAVDASGNVWVVDRGNNRLEKFTANGEYLTQFGSQGSGNGQFSEPRDVAITSAGNLWVTDAGNGRLQEFTSAGAFIRQVGINEGTILQPVDRLKEPYGVAIGTENRVWVTDPGNCAVELFSETSGNGKYFLAQAKALINPCTSTEKGAFRSPTGITADTENNAWAADAGLNRITQLRVQVSEPLGTSITTPSMFGSQGSGNGQLLEPAGIAIAGPGKLSVVDRGNNRVEQFTTAGEYQRQFGTLGSGAGQFSAPRGVVVTPGGAHYVTDGGNNRVEKWG